MKKKIVLHEEVAYLLAILLMAFSVAMLTAVDFGISMIVAPAYIISQKFPVLTFGQSEYVVQALIFLLFCLLMKKVRLVYFGSFLCCLIYGAVLDGWRLAVPLFNPAVTAPGSMALWARIVMFILGMFLTAISVALFFRVYPYPQVPEIFVKGVATRYRLNMTRFKRIYDVSCLTLAVVLTLLFFRKFVGVNWGTLVMTALNGVLIGFAGKIVDAVFVFRPLFPKLAAKFNQEL